MASASSESEPVVRTSATARAVVFSDRISVDAITIETRRWNPLLVPLPDAEAAATAFGLLPTNVAGYTNKPVSRPDLACNEIILAPFDDPYWYPDQNPGGPLCATFTTNIGDGQQAEHHNLATRYRVRITAKVGGDVSFRFGIDFNGGVALVDGERVASNYLDSWFYNTFYYENDASQVDVSTGVLQWKTHFKRGTTHVIEVVGFETGDDGGAAAQFDDGINGCASTVWAPIRSCWQDMVVGQQLQMPLAVQVVGGVGGRIKSAPDLDCGANCPWSFNWGTQPSLTSLPDEFFVFSEWGGACSGIGACAPMMDAAQSVSATFARTKWPLTVTRAGTGAGTVTSGVPGIDCGVTCRAGFGVGTIVELSASAVAGSTFSGWNGAGCSGTGACATTMDGAKRVTATFNPNTHLLTVTRTGTGSGSVSSTPSGITCGMDCAENYVEGREVTLSALPAVGSTFNGWSGACSGTGSCTTTMLAVRTVFASFAAIPGWDSTPPTLSCSATPNRLWPPNHKMVKIKVKVSFNDAGSGIAGGSKLWSVTSNEPDDAKESSKKDEGDDAVGDGNTINDIQDWDVVRPGQTGTDDVEGFLRAERAGKGTGRIYTLTYFGFDKAGNRGTGSCQVTVPHSNR